MNIKLPGWSKPFVTPMRYKIAYGGRGGSKSWTFAALALIKGAAQKLTVVCAREHLNSLDGSVYQLLCDLIRSHNLLGFYTIKASTIEGINGTVFKFKGLEKNVYDIKSFEGADICWIEEAVTITAAVWDILIPTIRKNGSEIWISFNPDLDTDATYRRFVLTPPTNSVVIKVGYEDNPYFNDIMKQEMEDCKRRDYDEYLNVWLGNCKHTVDGAVYAKELRSVIEESRITKVPYEPNLPVHTFWDLGYADYTCIWFAQYVGFSVHVIDYYQNHLEPAEHYLKILDSKKYRYGTAYLPHDAKNKTMQGAVSFEMTLEKAGFKAQALKYAERKSAQIRAVRDIFPKCYFDEIKCTAGLDSLRKYKYRVDRITGQYSRDPDHDEYSHGADAFAQLAVRLKPARKATPAITYQTDIVL